MALKDLVKRLADDLEVWSGTGINEAQTSQAIVLPLLQELGYDIWNPLEVVAQGSNHGYIPDYTVELNGKIRFIVEVKALNKSFSDNDQAQAVNYVNAQGRRWAILTDGRTWHFYDNKITKPAAEKLALTVDVQHKRAAVYLNKLLARQLWLKADANIKLATLITEVDGDIRKRIKLGEIEQKLKLELEEGFTRDAKGLEKAIQLTLEPNEKELALESFEELTLRLLRKADFYKSVDSSSNEIAEAVRQGIAKTTPTKQNAHGTDLTAWVADEIVEAVNWRDISAGIAEASILLGAGFEPEAVTWINASIDERKKSDGSVYPPHSYRKLSNQTYIFLHAGAKEHTRRSKKMLQLIGAPKNLIKVTYRNDEFYLP